MSGRVSMEFLTPLLQNIFGKINNLKLYILFFSYYYYFEERFAPTINRFRTGMAKVSDSRGGGLAIRIWV